MRVDYLESEIAGLIPYPDDADNKYSRGVVHVVGGSERYPGAAVLAAGASQRMGAGYTQVWCHENSIHDVRAGHPSLVVGNWDKDELGEKLLSSRNKPIAVLIGPGMGANAEQEKALLEVVLACEVPTVIDGGAIGHLADFYMHKAFCGEPLLGEGFLQERAKRDIPLIITPHLGEAARLCKAAGIEAQAQEDQAKKLAKAYGATVVLKGPDTVIANESQWYCMTQGTAALAKAGTGDVLAGMIAALLSQELTAFDSSCLGSVLHAKAGNLAARELTEICVTPEDVISFIPAAIAHVS